MFFWHIFVLFFIKVTAQKSMSSTLLRQSSHHGGSNSQQHQQQNSSSAHLQQQQQKFSIPSIPLVPPGSSRRPSISSSICERVPKYPYGLACRRQSTAAGTTTITTPRPRTASASSTSRRTSAQHESQNNNNNNDNSNFPQTNAVWVAASSLTGYKPRQTLSESTTKLNEMMNSNLQTMEKSSKRKSIFGKTQPKQNVKVYNAVVSDDDNDGDDDDEDEVDLDASLLNGTSTENSLTFGADGQPLLRKKKKTKKILRMFRNPETGKEEERWMTDDEEAEARRLEAEMEERKRSHQLSLALLEQAAALVSILAPESHQHDRRVEKTRPSEEELERLRQLEWEERNKLRPVDDDYRDFVYPRRWSAHRRIDAKMDFFRNSSAATARLHERMKFYKQCDRNVTIAARDSQEYRHRKLEAQLSGNALPPRPPSSSRPLSAHSWALEISKRRAMAAASDQPQQQQRSSPPTSSSNQTQEATTCSSPSPGPGSNNNAALPLHNSASLHDCLPKHQKQRPQSARMVELAVAKKYANLASASFTSRPASAHNIKSEEYSGKSEKSPPVPTFLLQSQKENNGSKEVQHQQQQRNYGEFHHIPIVEMPPRTATQWHVRNELWLQKALRHRSNRTKTIMIDEHERSSKAFMIQHASDAPPPQVRIPIL